MYHPLREVMLQMAIQAPVVAAVVPQKLVPEV
jgi:hypothetical protein